jgi:hypothetical protein
VETNPKRITIIDAAYVARLTVGADHGVSSNLQERRSGT